MQLPLEAELNAIFDHVAGIHQGEVADYIPALQAADPDWFGVSLVTVDNHRYDIGDFKQGFTIQSESKPFAYALRWNSAALTRCCSESASNHRAIRLTPSSST
nr:glutaminase [Mycobacterium genavense]